MFKLSDQSGIDVFFRVINLLDSLGLKVPEHPRWQRSQGRLSIVNRRQLFDDVVCPSHKCLFEFILSFGIRTFVNVSTGNLDAVKVTASSRDHIPSLFADKLERQKNAVTASGMVAAKGTILSA